MPAVLAAVTYSKKMETFLPSDGMLARYMLSSYVRPSVCPSVTSRHCTKTAKRIESRKQLRQL